MEIYECKYCHKTYKTLRGAKNHTCKQMQRYEEYTDVTDLVLNTVNSAFRLFSNLPKDKEERKIFFINNRFYDGIKAFEKWVLETMPVNFVEYVLYLKQNQIPMKNWTLQHVYHCFLYSFIRSENESMAIHRSKQHLESIGETMDTISPNKLYLELLYGKISPKYLKSIGYDASTILDEGQWKEVKAYF